MDLEQAKKNLFRNTWREDFKDSVEYKLEIDKEKLCDIQKWLVYDKYAKTDVNDVLKNDDNGHVLKILCWDNKEIAPIFSMKQLLYAVFRTIDFTEEDINKILFARDLRLLTLKFKQKNIDTGKDIIWGLERFARNVHMIGNYMGWSSEDGLEEAKSRVKGRLSSKEKLRDGNTWLENPCLITENLLRENVLSRQGTYNILEKEILSEEELFYLPSYLEIVNQFIEERTKYIKYIINKNVERELQECYEKEFDEVSKKALFLQVTDFAKGYFQVLPEYEEEFERVFGDEYIKYVDSPALDKVAWDEPYEGYTEYAYLSLYDFGVLDKKSFLYSEEHDGEVWDMRAIYYAFKKMGRVVHDRNIEFEELELDIMPKHIVDEEISGSADADRCEYTWRELYKKLYPESAFWKLANFESGIKEGYICYKGCKISGDTMFNFKNVDPSRNTSKNQRKYEYFEELIKSDYEEKDGLERYLNMLEECRQMTYSLHNFSLMPSEGGGMNKFKGSIYDEDTGKQLDRQDTFMTSLNKYYMDRNVNQSSKEDVEYESLYENSFFSKVTATGRYKEGISEEQKSVEKEKRKRGAINYLIPFLDEFRKGEKIKGRKGICSATYKYCKEMYLIDDKEFVEELIENGSKPIKTGEDVIRYMNLAKRYWKIKDKLLKQAESKE